MTPAQFNQIKKMIAAYWSTLDIKEVKAEFAKKGLLSQNKKLSKGDSDNWGLELLPSVLAPKLNLCEGAGKCKYTCLAFSGIGNVIKGKSILATENAKLNAQLMCKARKTFLYANDYNFFRTLLMNEIENKSLIADLQDKKFACRLNTTSDIDWSDIIDSMPNVQFYDYSKLFQRSSKPNYKITFSVDEKTTDEQIINKLENGENVAIVFHNVPKKYLNFDVVDGDENDDRYNDAKGIIIGLKYKTTIGGKDDTDFVR